MLRNEQRQDFVEYRGRRADSMASQQRREDRRIQRTRQILQQAFIEIVREKSQTMTSLRAMEKCFATTSIQEITERANVNRGTFYLHFTDKYMLVDTVVRERFHQQLLKLLPADPRWDRKTLHLFIQAILNLFEEKYHHEYQPSLVLSPMVERAIHEELTDIVLTWLTAARVVHQNKPESLDTIARVVSWAIFGTAIQWSQEAKQTSSEEMADIISQVIMEGVARLAPEALPG
jgi:AcrR family transcriptional regulator